MSSRGECRCSPVNQRPSRAPSWTKEAGRRKLVRHPRGGIRIGAHARRVVITDNHLLWSRSWGRTRPVSRSASLSATRRTARLVANEMSSIFSFLFFFFSKYFCGFWFQGGSLRMANGEWQTRMLPKFPPVMSPSCKSSISPVARFRSARSRQCGWAAGSPGRRSHHCPPSAKEELVGKCVYYVGDVVV